MGMTMQVDIVSAEQEIFSGVVEFLVAPAEQGEVGIMPRHNQMITRLKPGEVRLKLSHDQVQSFYVSGGILEVQPHVVTVLSDTALRAKDIDEAAVVEARRRAQDALQNRDTDVDLATATAQLAQANAQLELLRKLRKS